MAHEAPFGDRLVAIDTRSDRGADEGDCRGGVSVAGAAAGEGLSVIVPVLNEAAHLVPFLLHLRARAPAAEIIVVDGGSSDASLALARDVGVRVICAERGRPTQMNTGAVEATGDILWFLHADNEVPPTRCPR